MSDQQDPGSLSPEEADGSGSGTDLADEAFAHAVRGRSRRRKRRKMPGENIAYLNLTPMMDIMTMLLVFLVKSFEAAPENININAALRPPVSTTDVVMQAATKVTITKEAVLVDDLAVLSMTEVRPEPEASIAPLRDALIERVDHLKAVEQRGGAPFDGRLMVVADETTPYAVVNSVLLAAGESKFSQYKLVVLQKNQ